MQGLERYWHPQGGGEGGMLMSMRRTHATTDGVKTVIGRQRELNSEAWIGEQLASAHNLWYRQQQLHLCNARGAHAFTQRNMHAGEHACA